MSSDPQDRPDAKAEALEVLTFGRSGVDSTHCRWGLGWRTLIPSANIWAALQPMWRWPPRASAGRPRSSLE